MKFKILQFILVLGILVCFFMPMFHVGDKTITGFNAILSDDIMLFGNFILAIIFLATAAHLIFIVVDILSNELSEVHQNGMNMVVNINLIAGLLMITFLGLFTNIVAIICVVLMIATAYVRYKFL